MLNISSTVFIERDPETVFAYIANPENNPSWQSGMKSCMVTSEGPIAVGSTYQQVAAFLGRRIESNFEIVAYDAPHLIRGTTVESSFPITFTRTVEAKDGGTQVKTVVEGDSSGFFRIAEPLMRMLVKRSVDKDYVRLKRVLEVDAQ